MERIIPDQKEIIPVQAVHLQDMQFPLDKAHFLDTGVPVSICSYNILADAFIHYDNDTPKKYLEFKFRSQVVVETIKKIDSDIYILQEVDHLDFYIPAFTKLGYSMAYKSRDKKPDCVVILFKKAKFDMLRVHNIDLNKNHPFTNFLLYKKGNVAVCLELLHKQSNKRLVVLGTHLHWDPKVEQVRYLQTCMIVKFLEEKFKSTDAIFWGGDLNSKPNDNNIKYVCSRTEPSANNVEFGYKEIIAHEKNIFKEYSKSTAGKIAFENLYSKYGESVEDKTLTFPKYTNFKSYFKSTLDHIYFNPKKAVPIKIMRIDEEGIEKYKNLPAREYPSDHLPIMGVFLI